MTTLLRTGSELYHRLTSFAGRWAMVKVRADRITLAIARDQQEAWTVRETSSRRAERHRALAVMGWSDLLRSFALA